VFSDEIKPKRTKPHNKEVRPREYLTAGEIDQLLAGALKKRYSNRNYALVLLLFRHGLRVSEAADLKWSDIDTKAGIIYIRRLKNGRDSTHYLERKDLAALKSLPKNGVYVFCSSRQPFLSERAIHRIVAEAGVTAGISFPVHPHMLRHACGFALANQGVDTRTIQGYLGHSSISSTVIYTELAPNRFKGIGDLL
jgi:type 1 fimbriae regulatory protein FimB/type 1 fimbriae regulatory protein FimE